MLVRLAIKNKDKNKFVKLLKSLDKQNLITMVHVSKGREFIWTKTNYERWKADTVQLLFSEIEKSGVNGVKLSELKKKIDAKGKMEELLKTLEEQNLIVRGKKGETTSFWTKDNYEKWKTSVKKLKKITTEDVYKALEELRAHVDQKFSEILSILEDIKEKH